MARGFCVDCNYQGALNPQGDCPRCGSEWTTGGSQLMGFAQLEDLDKMTIGGTDTSDDFTTTGEYYIL
ncbi:MAG TPA: hypothetical protein EYN66_22725 [Myxococcales bacterium]|nr:hypothetical protein [Myxococcales bacterium]